MAGEEVQDDDPAGTGAEDSRGLVAHVLDQAPDIVDVGLEPAIVVLRPIEPAPRKATPVVGDNGVVRREMFRHHSESVGYAGSPRDHDHGRAAAVGLVVEPSAGNFEDAHLRPL